MLKRTWKQIDAVSAGDEKGYLHLQLPEGLKVQWVSDGPKGHKFEAADYFRVDYTLEPGQCIAFDGAFRAMPGAENLNGDFDFDAVKKEADASWEVLMQDLKVVPNTENQKYQDVYHHLAMQLYQMLARYEGSDWITTRQGDLGRYIWPYEASLVLTTMDIVGMQKYTGEAYRFFCERWFVNEGEDEGRIQSSCAAWENFTGMILWGLSEHLKMAGTPEEYAYFMPKLRKMLGWIQRHRSESYGGYEGIFPVGRGSDWKDHAQFWTFTDSYNVRGIKSLAEMMDQYGNPEAKEVWEIHDEYRGRLIEIRDALYKGHEEDEAYIFPHELGIPFEDSETYSYYTDGAPVLLRTGLMDANSKMRVQMENYFRSRGQFERGRTGLMTSCESAWDGAYHGASGDVWYTIQSELYWVPAWMEAGEVDKAKESVEALLKYGITKEYITSERYCSIDKWYSPWQPNASGSASLMQILLSYFGEKREE